MSDLISRKMAVDAIHEDADWLAAQGSDWQEERMERDKSILMSLPSAEPEVIRCKECKHWYKDADSDMSCEYTAMSQPEDGFCNWAERGGEKE